jgi:hypothetical protein
LRNSGQCILREFLSIERQNSQCAMPPFTNESRFFCVTDQYARVFRGRWAGPPACVPPIVAAVINSDASLPWRDRPRWFFGRLPLIRRRPLIDVPRGSFEYSHLVHHGTPALTVPTSPGMPRRCGLARR